MSQNSTMGATLDAYQQGYRAGQADKSLGQLAEYAWYGALTEHPSSYTFWYSKGYRAARGGA